jgi:hypothetical protein
VKMGGVIKWVLELELENALVYLLHFWTLQGGWCFFLIIDLNPSSVTIVVCKIYLNLITKEASITYVELMSLQIHCLGGKAI